MRIAIVESEFSVTGSSILTQRTTFFAPIDIVTLVREPILPIAYLRAQTFGVSYFANI